MTNLANGLPIHVLLYQAPETIALASTSGATPGEDIVDPNGRFWSFVMTQVDA